MFLTHSSRPNASTNTYNFPWRQLLLLALVRLAEPVSLTSILPYAWPLVRHFGVREQNASLFAGLLISAFSGAEALTGFYWGGVSDRIGRKPVLLIGCAGTVVSLLIVGFATNFWVALAGRALGGLLNGNIGVIQTMVGESVKRREHEPKAYSIMPFVWSVGTIAGPAIGGCLAQPAENFPSIFSSHGLFGRFPYLLPNLVCSALMIVAIMVGQVCIYETHPAMQGHSIDATIADSTAETPLMRTAGATEHAPADIVGESYGTFNAVEIQDVEAPISEKEWVRQLRDPVRRPGHFTNQVFNLIFALSLFTFHAMAFDHMLPIFLQDGREKALMAGGLGLPVQQVGIIMAINGMIALFIQAVIFPFMASRFGVWKTLRIVTVGFPTVYFAVPFLTGLSPSLVKAGIFSSLTLRNFFSILAYPLLLIMLKEACPDPSQLGKINGLAASVGAASRTVASPLAGFLYDIGSQKHFAAIPWWSTAVVALIGAVQIFFVSREKKQQDEAYVRTLAHFASKEDVRFGNPASVHIMQQHDEVDEPEESDYEAYVNELRQSDSETSTLNGNEDEGRRGSRDQFLI